MKTSANIGGGAVGFGAKAVRVSIPPGGFCNLEGAAVLADPAITARKERKESSMNTKLNFTNNSWKHFNRLSAALALALIVPARAGTQPAAIPFSDIGARSTANYQGDALGITATTDGARLRCGFQKLAGQATTEGLWLESTKPGAAGRLRVTASALCRSGSQPPLNPQPSSGHRPFPCRTSWCGSRVPV